MNTIKELYPELYERGLAYEALGRALLDDSTTLAKVAALAWSCGLELQIRIVSSPPPRPSNPKGEAHP